MDLEYKDAMDLLIADINQIYKKNIETPTYIKKLQENSCEDYNVYMNIHNGTEILKKIIKYALWANKDKWHENTAKNNIEELSDLNELIIDLPENSDDVKTIFIIYPWSKNILVPELINIMNLQKYKLMIKIANIHKLLYFSTVTSEEFIDIVLSCKKDEIAFWTNIKLLIDKINHEHKVGTGP